MTTPLEDFREYLLGNKLRLTRERERLIEIIFSLGSPFTEDSLLAAVHSKQKQIRIRRSATYRTLQMLVDSGQVVILSETVGGVQYSHNYEQVPTGPPIPNLCQSTHSHLIAGTCPWCGSVIINGEITAW